MDAICIRQPYAELVLRGIKPHEIRGWRFDPHDDRILIVASSQWGYGWREVMHEYGLTPADCPRGVMVGTVEVSEFLSPTKSYYDPKALCDVDASVYQWVTAQPRRVIPRAVKGKLNLFHVDDALIVHR